MGSGDEYWVAGRRIGTAVNSMAIMAALASGGSIIGVMGLAYAQGIPATLALFGGAVVGFPLASVLVAKPLRNFGKFTITDFLVCVASALATSSVVMAPMRTSVSPMRIPVELCGANASRNVSSSSSVPSTSSCPKIFLGRLLTGGASREPRGASMAHWDWSVGGIRPFIVPRRRPS